MAGRSRVPGLGAVEEALGREATAAIESVLERLAVKKKKPARPKPAPPAAAPLAARPAPKAPAPKAPAASRAALAVKKTPAAPAVIRREGEQLRLFPQPTPRVVKSPEELLSDPAFLRWFRQSQVVDQSLRPQRVYHGSYTDSPIFNTQGGERKTAGTGAFFSSNPDVASSYAPPEDGGLVKPVYLSMQQPLVLHAAGDGWDRLGADLAIDDPFRPGATPTLGEYLGLDRYDDATTTDDFVRFARESGYDGAIIRNVLDRGGETYPPSNYSRWSDAGASVPATTYSVFKPQQIKSIFNTEFDPEDWRVHRAKGGAVTRKPPAGK